MDRKMDEFRSLSPAVWRASTVLFDNITDFTQRKERLFDGYTYGVTGTPTTRALEEAIARLEEAKYCVVSPSGQSALCQVGLALLSAGDHVLIADSAYGPLRAFAQDYLKRFGVEYETYDPCAGAEVATRFKPNTKLIFMESPGSITMEMQDIPFIVRASQAAGVTTVLDNSWASPLGFKGVPAGVDIVVEAASKLFGGHSDLLLGSIATNSRALYEKVRTSQSVLGQAVSPDDCFLVLRGLDTFALRYAHQSAAALLIAESLSEHAAVEHVLFPPSPKDGGHARWRATFQGGGCVLSFVPKLKSAQQVHRFFDALKVFRIGASWGGVHSLAAYYPESDREKRTFCRVQGGIVRLSVGVEPAEKLLQDIQQALDAACE